MKLLIVDDEEITREGIVQRVPWFDLGIDKIQQADDGVNGLLVSEWFKPDIVLTDVRMPRMDGIQMCLELKESFPNCVFIFVSGYSDKDYLKSALYLKAVDYIDKPISLQELKHAVEKAVARCREADIKKQTEFVADTYMKVGIHLLRSELALFLLNKDFDMKQAAERAHVSCIHLPEDGFYSTAAVKFLLNEEYPPFLLNSIKALLHDFLENAYPKYGINAIAAFKSDEHLVLHLITPPFEKHLLSEQKLYSLFHDMSCSLKSLSPFIISIGKTVQGFRSIHNSYETAVSGLERAFFRGYNCIVTYQNTPCSHQLPLSIPVRNFADLIDKGKWEDSISFVKSKISELRCSENMPVNTVKNFFYSLLLELYRLAKHKGFDIFDSSINETHMWAMFLKFNTLSDIEQFITEKLNMCFENVNLRNKQNCIIDKICKFVQTHYFDYDLSIDKICEYTRFSPTYICGAFKEKTGKTLNQYITEYRIEKSKEFLKNIDLKVSDICLKVGYMDSGYFTKLFRKATGVTPSEFRERYVP